ncbi:MAG: hypothetical protein LLG01_10800, partial [Planctomycetaceae bacterium]|nr:hypothetical protein [Planctomycetaceae bacterium]
MRWQHPIVGVLLMLAVWAALAAWQYDEYGRECQLARETVQRQADSIQSALVGGIRSHRRLGRFFQDQLQGSLDELVASKDILAVALTADDGQTVLSAGQTKLLPNPSAMAAGAFW